MPKVKVKTPSGKLVIREKKKKPKRAHCGRCGKQLGGVESKSVAEMRKLAKSKKIPTRPYAGVLCNNCLESLLRYKVRFEAKFSNPEFKDLELHRDLTIEKFLPRGWFASLQNLQEK
ncbi:MAG: 50S ribosomal protein L34e [Candidatus Altiarchaeota archaeon]